MNIKYFIENLFKIFYNKSVNDKSIVYFDNKKIHGGTYGKNCTPRRYGKNHHS